MVRSHIPCLSANAAFRTHPKKRWMTGQRQRTAFPATPQPEEGIDLHSPKGKIAHEKGWEIVVLLRPKSRGEGQ